MKAMRYHSRANEYGLQVEEVNLPELVECEVLVEVVATSVNPSDWSLASLPVGRCGAPPPPFVPGTDFSGIVRALGPGVTRFTVGDRVFGAQPACRRGTFAEYVAAAESNVALAPQSISLATAAAVPLAALTAWTLLDLAEIEVDQTVLIHGGTTGAGSFAIQFARHRGARVIATGSGRDEDFLRSLGAHAMLDPGAAPSVKGLPRVHAVLDVLGDRTLEAWIPRIREGGVVASTTDLGSRLASNRRVRASFADLNNQRDLAALDLIRALIDAGTIRVPVTKQLPLDWAEVALAKSRDGLIQGKVLLHI